ncbi:histone H3.v1-like [Acanthaster planci]|uniref:Histone H3.v1-like n=1 Tax=Acanthaster planci TaxID=133434 RepID=A0A8B7YBA6_ACAPL|nr:histone H3.v1-like [Acanthaster planci]
MTGDEEKLEKKKRKMEKKQKKMVKKKKVEVEASCEDEEWSSMEEREMEDGELELEELEHFEEEEEDLSSAEGEEKKGKGKAPLPRSRDTAYKKQQKQAAEDQLQASLRISAREAGVVRSRRQYQALVESSSGMRKSSLTMLLQLPGKPSRPPVVLTMTNRRQRMRRL